MSAKLLIFFFLVVSLTCFGQKDSFPEINFKIEINSREQSIIKLRDSQKNDSVTVAEINSDSLSYYLKKFENFKLVDLWLISPKTKKLENDLEKQKDEMLILVFWCPKLKEFSNDYFIGFESLRRLDLYVNLKKFPSELCSINSLEELTFNTEKKRQIQFPNVCGTSLDYFTTNSRITKRNINSILNIDAETLILEDVNKISPCYIKLLKFKNVIIRGDLTTKEQDLLKTYLPQSNYQQTNY